MALIFVTGGTRSGKSSFAQQRAEEADGNLLYVATAEVRDEEMADRVRLHKDVRGDRWATLEEPFDLVGKLPASIDGKGAIMIDCLTLWLTNWFFRCDEDIDAVCMEAEKMIDCLAELPVPVYLVSNEIGFGVVPENAMARKFRDLAGKVNQLAAARGEEAWLVVSGIPLQLK